MALIKTFLKKNISLFLKCLWTILILSFTLETYFYSGFLKNHVWIPILITFTVGIAFFIYRNKIQKPDNISKKYLNKVIKLFYFILFSVTVFLTISEKINYSNYVFSKYHLHLNGLYLMVFVSTFYIVVFEEKFRKFEFRKFKLVRSKKRSILNLKKILLSETQNLLILFVIVFVLINNFLSLFPDIDREFHLTLNNFFVNYDTKMIARWGDFYKYMLFIEKNIPENAVIYHPSDLQPYMDENNQEILRYFLYPRTLVSDDALNSEYNSLHITHILIVGLPQPVSIGGIKYYSWPFSIIKNGKVFILGSDYDEKEFYDPTNIKYQDERGIITL